MQYGRNSLESPRSAATSLTGPATIRDLMVRMLAIRGLPPADAEHVIPSTRINTGRVVTQLVGDLIHFKRRRLGLERSAARHDGCKFFVGPLRVPHAFGAGEVDGSVYRIT